MENKFETLIKTERCADGTLARYVRDARGIVYVEFFQIDEQKAV